MAKPSKVSAVAEITEKFRGSSAAVITEYRGLSMAQLTTLRRALGTGATYTVSKNTLVKRAAQDAGVEGLELAVYARDNQLTALARVRELGDQLEKVVADDLWPLPKYSEILFIK